MEGRDRDPIEPPDRLLEELRQPAVEAGEEHLEALSCQAPRILSISGDALDREYLARWIETLDLADAWGRAEALAEDGLER